MGFLDSVGEREELGTGRVVLPESLYIAMLGIGPDPSVTEPRLDTVKQADGTEIEVEKGGTPFVTLTSSVMDGPFEGVDVTGKYYLSPGGVKLGKYGLYGGGMIPLYKHVVPAITGKGLNEAALTAAGFSIDSAQLKSLDPAAADRFVRLEIARWYTTLDPTARLAVMLKFLRIAEWDGKKVVVKFSIETRKYVPAGSTEEKTYVGNKVETFYALSDAKHGEKYVKAIAHVKQEAALKAMEEAAAAE